MKICWSYDERPSRLEQKRYTEAALDFCQQYSTIVVHSSIYKKNHAVRIWNLCAP